MEIAHYPINSIKKKLQIICFKKISTTEKGMKKKIKTNISKQLKFEHNLQRSQKLKKKKIREKSKYLDLLPNTKTKNSMFLFFFLF